MHVFNMKTWEAEVLKSDLPVLVDFWGPSCAPCIALAPLLEEVSQTFEGALKVGKVNVNMHSPLAAKYGIRAIPTLLLFRDGEVVGQKVGVVQKRELDRFLQKVLG